MGVGSKVGFNGWRSRDGAEWVKVKRRSSMGRDQKVGLNGEDHEMGLKRRRPRAGVQWFNG